MEKEKLRAPFRKQERRRGEKVMAVFALLCAVFPAASPSTRHGNPIACY